jgi:outer membrane protein OmpA-like peptidoglycan-associated protein
MHKRMLWAGLLAAATANASPPNLSQHPRVGELTEIEFSIGSAQVSVDNNQRIGQVAGWAQQNPDGLIVLDGHADTTGDSAQNVELSVRRATAVRDELVSLHVDPERIIVAAFGDTGPQRAKIAENRRVTVWGTREGLDAVLTRLEAMHARVVAAGGVVAER